MAILDPMNMSGNYFEKHYFVINCIKLMVYY